MEHTKHYRWEVGPHIWNAIQARDLPAAEKAILEHVDSVMEVSGKRPFDEVKMRVLALMSFGCHAARNADADPDKLIRAALRFIRSLLQVETLDRLVAACKRALKEYIALVPDEDLRVKTKLNLAIDYIDSHLTAHFTRDDVARAAECSPAHLSRLFRQTYGRTFKQHVLERRIARAKELLRTTDGTIAEIAYALGYDDPNFFSASFRRLTGVTPTQFRKSNVSWHSQSKHTRPAKGMAK